MERLRRKQRLHTRTPNAIHPLHPKVPHGSPRFSSDGGCRARCFRGQLRRGRRQPRPSRVGLIGCGWYGKCDLLRLLQVANVEVVSLCDVDSRMLDQAATLVAGRQRNRQRPRTYRDYREMLRPRNLDIALVGTPDHWHALPTIAARGGRLRCVGAEADQRGHRRGQGDGRGRPQASQGGAGRLAAAQHAAYRRCPRAHRAGRTAGPDRPRRDLLLLPHADAREPARRRPADEPRLRDVDRPRADAAATTAWSIRAAGGRSRSTATASSATCACTCSTWSAGCSTSAGRGASARRAAFWWIGAARRTSPTRRPRRSTSATRRWFGSTAPGAPRPIPIIPGARPSTATAARSR